MGPLEFIVIGLDEGKFQEVIAPELCALRDRGHVRVLDVLLISRDGDETVSSSEMSDLSDDEACSLTVLQPDGLEPLDAEDIPQVAEALSRHASVAVVLVEHLWSKALGRSIALAGGSIVAQGFISRHVLADVEELVGA